MGEIRPVAPETFDQAFEFVSCIILRCAKEELEAALAARANYHVFRHQKPGKKWRMLVRAPLPLAALQRRLDVYLQSRYDIFCREKGLGEVVHGFVRGKSSITNAARHRRGYEFFLCDFRNAFGQIDLPRVREIFLTLGFNRLATEVLAELVTLGGVLPEGVATSPALFNWACWDLDRELRDLCCARFVTYTRYADDMCFSSRFGEELNKAIPEILAVIRKHGFVLASRKSRRLSVKNGAVHVTGISINDLAVAWPHGWDFSRGRVRLPRKTILRYRSFLAHAAGGERSQEEVAGMLGWVRAIYHGELPAQLRKPYEKYLAAVKSGRVPKRRR